LLANGFTVGSRSGPSCVRASDWYAANSDIPRAIEHAIAANDVPRAGELIWHAFPEMSGRGRMATLGRWLDQLGSEAVASSVPITLSRAHYHLVLGEGDGAAGCAKLAEELGPSPGGSPVSRLTCTISATLAADGALAMGAKRKASSCSRPSPWWSPATLRQCLEPRDRDREACLLREAPPSRGLTPIRYWRSPISQSRWRGDFETAPGS
jgi:hypothetical protein